MSLRFSPPMRRGRVETRPMPPPQRSSDSMPLMLMIGMLGGMSWESSAEYYRLANELVRERLGGLHSARCLLASVDFADIEAMQVAGEWEAAGKVLAETARGLEAGGGRRSRLAPPVHQHDAQGRGSGARR